jgi:urease accessory protein
MDWITTRAAHGSAHQDVLQLSFELRSKSRLRTKLESGEEVALQMPRGHVLRDGDLLATSRGAVVLVRAAPEVVSTLRADDPIALARAAYHLGNRHIAVQVGAGWLRYQHDHVLDDMVRALGLAVVVEKAPFEPEGGAYGNGHDHPHAQRGGHGGDHDHDHDHGHHHDHNHDHDHRD